MNFSYNAEGNRVSKCVTTGSSNPTTTGVKDVYQLGYLSSERCPVNVRRPAAYGQDQRQPPKADGCLCYD